jgi:cytochrome c-type biogenesis protein CcmH
MMRSWLSLGLLLFLLLAPAAGLAVGSPSEMLPDTAQESRAEAIGSQLRCLVCQNESIEDSGADLARDLRHVVRVHVAQGESNRQIITWMVERYGNFIRLQPPFNAMTLLLWGMPLLALALGGMAAGFAWRTRRVAPPPLTESEHRRLADLLEHS